MVGETTEPCPHLRITSIASDYAKIAAGATPRWRPTWTATSADGITSYSRNLSMRLHLRSGSPNTLRQAMATRCDQIADILPETSRKTIKRVEIKLLE